MLQCWTKKRIVPSKQRETDSLDKREAKDKAVSYLPNTPREGRRVPSSRGGTRSHLLPSRPYCTDWLVYVWLEQDTWTVPLEWRLFHWDRSSCWKRQNGWLWLSFRAASSSWARSQSSIIFQVTIRLSYYTCVHTAMLTACCKCDWRSTTFT